ncbi:MAG: hypothetical protein H7833_08730 [Magnetococcus sp. DMHC-1]|nr:hypothetical protein [Magnetococcales bacterium]
MNALIDVSGQVLDIGFIWKYYQESLKSLNFRKNYFIMACLGKIDMDALENFDIGIDLFETPTSYFDSLVTELENLIKFNLLSAIEGRIRHNLAVRINDKQNNFMSGQFAVLHAHAHNQAAKISFQGKQGILQAWKRYLADEPEKLAMLAELESILELRHWLAHGRWWNLQPTCHLSVEDVKDIVENALHAMDL